MGTCSICGHRGKDVDVIMVCPTCSSVKRAVSLLTKEKEFAQLLANEWRGKAASLESRLAVTQGEVDRLTIELQKMRRDMDER